MYGLYVKIWERKREKTNYLQNELLLLDSDEDDDDDEDEDDEEGALLDEEDAVRSILVLGSIVKFTVKKNLMLGQRTGG